MECVIFSLIFYVCCRVNNLETICLFLLSMSSSRANAAARQRRAGGAELNSNQPQPQQKMQPGKQPHTTKLSISDAIALITLRLGKVEGIVSNYQSDQLQVQVDQNGQPIQNAKMIDDSVFKSIVSRLDVLEKNQKVLMENQTSIANTVKSLATSKQSGGQTIIKDVSDEKLVQVNESVEFLKEEIRQSNNTVFNLQSFVQELSQKMVELIMTSDGSTMIDGEQTVQFANNEDGIQEEDVNDETVVDSLVLDLEGGEDSGPILELNMKEFIQSELASSSDL